VLVGVGWVLGFAGLEGGDGKSGVRVWVEDGGILGWVDFYGLALALSKVRCSSEPDFSPVSRGSVRGRADSPSPLPSTYFEGVEEKVRALSRKCRFAGASARRSGLM